jgi:hypothetical protein
MGLNLCKSQKKYEDIVNQNEVPALNDKIIKHLG